MRATSPGPRSPSTTTGARPAATGGSTTKTTISRAAGIAPRRPLPAACRRTARPALLWTAEAREEALGPPHEGAAQRATGRYGPRCPRSLAERLCSLNLPRGQAYNKAVAFASPDVSPQDTEFQPWRGGTVHGEVRGQEIPFV